MKDDFTVTYVSAFVDPRVGKEKIIITAEDNENDYTEITLEKKFDMTEPWRANCSKELLTKALLSFADQVETK